MEMGQNGFRIVIGVSPSEVKSVVTVTLFTALFEHLLHVASDCVQQVGLGSHIHWRGYPDSSLAP